jgi:hypothetical protein
MVSLRVCPAFFKGVVNMGCLAQADRHHKYCTSTNAFNRLIRESRRASGLWPREKHDDSNRVIEGSMSRFKLVL